MAALSLHSSCCQLNPDSPPAKFPKAHNAGRVATAASHFLHRPGQCTPTGFRWAGCRTVRFSAQPGSELLRVIPGNHDDRPGASAPAIIRGRLLQAPSATHRSHCSMVISKTPTAKGSAMVTMRFGVSIFSANGAAIFRSLPERTRRNDHHGRAVCTILERLTGAQREIIDGFQRPGDVSALWKRIDIGFVGIDRIELRAAWKAFESLTSPSISRRRVRASSACRPPGHADRYLSMAARVLSVRAACQAASSCCSCSSLSRCAASSASLNSCNRISASAR